MMATTLEDTVEATVDLLQVVLWVGLGALAGLVASYVVTGLMRGLNRRHEVAGTIVRRGRRPFQLALVVAGMLVAFALATQVPDGIRVPGWRDPALHALLIGLILAVTWFLAQMVRVIEDAALARVNRDGVTERGRRVQTQAQVLRRVGVAIVVVVGASAALLTFPGARAAGASLLASAGIISVVAGLAAQTTLGNVFAGVQLAFTDAIRVDDIVIAEGEFGYIEEITLTYVVVRLWDDRRLIMPSTYFTTTPFENWTRQAPALLGTVVLDADWRLPVPAMRMELERLLRHTDLWDGRVGILQVESATGGGLQVRALVSGKDAGTLTDLKYYLREHLVDWLQTVAPYALPRARYEPQEVVELTDRRTDPMYRELREEVTELAELDGAGESPEDTLAAPPLPEDPEERREREAAARRARRRAAREDRRRFRSGEDLRARAADRRPPSTDATVVLDAVPGARVDTAHEDRGGAPTPGVRRTLVGRLDGDDRPDVDAGSEATVSAGHEASLFSGSKEAEERAQAFSGPGEEAFAEREQSAERKRSETPARDAAERGRPDIRGKDARPDDAGADGGGAGDGD